MELEDFKYNIVFKSIIYNIKGRKNLSENSKIYIDWAQELFQSVAKSLDSMLDKSYYFTPHLKEIIKCSGEKIPKTKKEIIKLNKKFSLVINNLNNLKENPHKFYETKDAEEMLSLVDKLGNIYAIESHNIVSE